MKRYVKQSVEEGSSRFVILDEQGKESYRVTGRFTTAGSLLFLEDALEQTKAKIRQTNLLLAVRYAISVTGRSKSIFLTQSLPVAGATPILHLSGVDWRFRGDLLQQNFDFIQVDGSLVFSHCKRWGEWGDCYEVNIELPQWEIPSLCVSICLDNMVPGTGGVVPVAN